MSRRWWMLAAVVIANALPEFLWSNFPPIMTVVAEKYRIGEVAASLPIISFSVGTVLSAGLAGYVIDRRGYQHSLHLGLALLAACAWLRMLEGPFWLLVLAQGGIGAGFSFIVASTSSYVVDWFEERHEALVTGVCMVGLFCGLGSSMIVSPLLVSAYGFEGMLRITAAGAAAAFVIGYPLIRQRRFLPPSTKKSVSSLTLMRNRTLFLFFLISFLQQGVFSAVATALEVVWSKRGFSAEDAGLANGLFIFGGIGGSFLMPLLQERLLGGRMTLVVCYLVALLLTYPLFVVSSPGLGNVIAVILGIFWLGSLPVSLTLLEKVAGAERAGSASSVYWAFASAGSVALVWLFNAVAESWSWQPAAALMLVLLTINELATLALPRAAPIAALFWLGACLAAPVGASAADTSVAVTGVTATGVTVTAEDYARAARFLPSGADPLVTHSLTEVGWLADDSVWYRTMTDGGSRLVRVDPRDGRARPMSDPTQPAATPAAGSGGAPESVSPDRQRAVFIRDHNLWVRELTSGAERQLTTDGVQDFGYATDNPGWEHSAQPIVTWSPDSTKLATFQQDERSVRDTYLVNTQPGHPTLERWKYPMAGDAHIATIQRVIVDLAAHRLIRLQVPPDAHRSSGCYDVQCGDGRFADVQWSPDGSHLAFVSTSRDHREVRLRIADTTTGAVREVLEERSPTYYESDISSTDHVAINWRYLPASKEVIWFSERDGYAHLYLYDLRTGKLEHQITRGDWNVVELLQVDEKSRTLYFEGVGHEKGRDPYFVHLYRIGMDGRHLSLLTPENANHEVSLAPDGAYFVDRYSTPETAPVAVLRDRHSRLIATLEHADISKLIAAGWKPPVPIIVKARDGVTDLYGLLFKPSRFDAARRYPVIDWVYPGPHIGSVGSRAFAAARGDRQALAELGFIVVAIDGMGTPFRSKAFHDVSYGNLADNTLPDQVAGLRQLAQRYAWIDLTRAGIYGHSGGGYAAATAMLRYPDFFQVGVAESGNYDPRGYTDDWAEKFMGLPQTRPDGSSSYGGQDTPSLAGNLRGHLMLVHGTMDDNVPPNLTLLLVDALIQANKNFDLLLLPNQAHDYEGRAAAYAMRRRWDYFVRYLLGSEPPHQVELPVQPAGTPP